MKVNYLKLSIFIALTIGINAMDIIGKIIIKGSAPHTFMVIEDANSSKSYAIANSKEFNLSSMQNETINIEANIIKSAIGAGFPALIEVLKVK
jgi:hypothetical protein